MKVRNKLSELVSARAPKRVRTIPPNSVRRSRSPRPSRGVELFYLIAMQRLAAKLATAIHAKVAHLVPKIAKLPSQVERTDAEEEEGEEEDEGVEEGLSAEEIEEIEDAVSEARDAAARVIEEPVVENTIGAVSKRSVEHSKKEFTRLGIDVRKEPNLGKLIDKWRTGNVDRIKSVSEDQLGKVDEILRAGWGMRPEALAERLSEQIVGVSRSRLEFIARNETLNLNAQITRQRQTACGIEKYIWTTSNDERVRPVHDELEGEVCSWDDPPEINEDGDVGHPGDDYNCRCIPYPILPELSDEEEDDADGDDGDEGDDSEEEDDAESEEDEADDE